MDKKFLSHQSVNDIIVDIPAQNKSVNDTLHVSWYYFAIHYILKEILGHSPKCILHEFSLTKIVTAPICNSACLKIFKEKHKGVSRNDCWMQIKSANNTNALFCVHLFIHSLKKCLCNKSCAIWNLINDNTVLKWLHLVSITYSTKHF